MPSNDKRRIRRSDARDVAAQRDAALPLTDRSAAHEDNAPSLMQGALPDWGTDAQHRTSRQTIDSHPAPDIPNRPDDDPAHPSRYRVHPWIIAVAPNGPPRPCPHPGKWLVFVSRPWVDVRRAVIRAAVDRGDLGPSAKVSTALHPGRSHVICVYTADWRDRADVARVLSALRALGIRGRLFYKPNEHDVYARNGMRASVYCSDAFETLPLWDDSAVA